MSGIVSKNGTRGSGIIGTGAIGADAVGNSNIADDSIDSEHYVDGSIDTAHLAADAITGAKIGDDAIDSEHYTDASIDAAHIASNAVTTAKINADAVTGAKIADDAIDSEHYVDGSIDTAHIAADAVTGAKIADDTLNSEHYAAASVDLEHMSSESVDEDNLHISNSGSNGQFLSKQSGNAGGLTWATPGGGGKLLQVVSATKTDTATNGSGTYSSITGLSVDITPASSSNKVLVFWNVNVNGNNDGSCIGIIRDSTLIAEADSYSSTIPCTANTYTTNAGQIRNLAGQHLDSPSSTSALTYAVQWKSEGSQTDYLNRAESEGTSSRCVSSITVMEIGA